MLIKEVKKMEKTLMDFKPTGGEYSSTDRLCQCIAQKSKKVKEYKKAINNNITIKQNLLHKGNEIKLHPNVTQEKLGLKKLPTEKQTQAYIDETYKDETDDLAISKENINIIKKELELIDDEIQMWKYIIQMELKE